MTTQAEAGPYSRFYWRFIEEFPGVYDDKPTFGWWVTLLVIAEGAHPSPAQLPHGVPRRVLDKLVDAELLTLGTGFRYRVRGVAKERTRRSEAARVGGKARHRSPDAEQSSSERLAFAEQTVSLNETSRAETSKDETSKPRSNGKAIGEKPWVTLTPEEREARNQAEKDEAIRQTMLRVGLKPEPVA